VPDGVAVVCTAKSCVRYCWRLGSKLGKILGSQGHSGKRVGAGGAHLFPLVRHVSLSESLGKFWNFSCKIAHAR